MSTRPTRATRRSPSCLLRRRLAALVIALLACGAAVAQGPDGGELGATTYTQCAACHQVDGGGIPAAFPPLVGHAPELASVEGGRQYLATLTLYGLMGEISVDGVGYNGVMTPHAHLDDEALAAVLNHVLHAWGNAEALPDDFVPYSAEDVAAERGRGLSPADVYEIRGDLDLDD